MSLREKKTVRYIPEESGGEEHVFKLRLIYIWNKTSKRRTSGLTWAGENELVDLFYAITDCHGRIRSTKTEVVVRLEPLQQPNRRIAQEQLCRKLTSLGARTPLGKRMIIEIDGALT